MASPVTSLYQIPKVVDSFTIFPAVVPENTGEEYLKVQPEGSSQDAEKRGALALLSGQNKLKTENEANSQLWNRVHCGIRPMHEKARVNPFLLNLIEGKMNCSKAYVVYLCNLYWLHAALEAAQKAILSTFGDGFFIFPELFRSQKILADIKLWSVFNETAHLFADKDPSHPEFIRSMEPYIQDNARELARLLKDNPLDDLPRVFGTMYALYGTIMSGGQFVKNGVKTSFLERLQWQVEEHLEVINTRAKAEKADKDSLEYAAKEYSLAKQAMIKQALTNPESKEKMADDSVALFSFDSPAFNIAEFKREWHQSLNNLPEKLKLKDDELALFERQLIECSNSAILTIIEMIASLEENLRKAVI